jgi:hypothetical protein
MGSQRFLAMTSKREELLECVRLLEGRSGPRRGLAVTQLLDGLRRKVEWLDKLIGLELQQSDPLETPTTFYKTGRSHAA